MKYCISIRFSLLEAGRLSYQSSTSMTNKHIVLYRWLCFAFLFSCLLLSSQLAAAAAVEGESTERLSDDLLITEATLPSDATMTGHGEWVGSVAFSTNGSLLASGSGDKSIRLWNPATGEHIRTLEGHTDAVRWVAFSADGSLLASRSYDNTIRLEPGSFI